MRDYLKDLPEAEEIIAKLKDLKFINDVEYATWHTENRARFRPKSKRMLAMELKLKGISREEIGVVVDELSDEEQAISALSKKLRLWEKLSPVDFKTKATRFLASRGFSWGTIETVLKKRYNNDNVS